MKVVCWSLFFSFLFPAQRRVVNEDDFLAGSSVGHFPFVGPHDFTLFKVKVLKRGVRVVAQ